MTNDPEMIRKGLEARRRVLGAEYVDATLASVDAFNVDFQRLLTEYCWGHVWNQPALTDKQRSMNNVCLLAALGKADEFRLHFAGAIRNGATLDELKETLIQIAVYCGVPTGVQFFKIARGVIEELRLTPETADFHE